MLEDVHSLKQHFTFSGSLSGAIPDLTDVNHDPCKGRRGEHLVSHTFQIRLKEVNPLAGPSGQAGIHPLPALPSIVMSLVFLSGHEHSVLVPAWGEGGSKGGLSVIRPPYHVPSVGSLRDPRRPLTVAEVSRP